MQTLIPQPAGAAARPIGRFGRWWRFGMTPLAMYLLAGGLAMALPAFWHHRAIWFVPVWDGLVLLVWLVEAVGLSAPERLHVARAFLDSPQLGQDTRVELRVRMDADRVLAVRCVDDLHPALVAEPKEQRLKLYPREDVASVITVWPRERGDFALGRVYVRMQGMLAERWCAALPVAIDSSDGSSAAGQQVRVYPALEESRDRTQFFLLRARQIALEKRKLRLRGVGREFENLRDYQPGDELRHVSWTATARRGRPVTRQFTMERSQQVWIVLDAGRLSRTALELKRDARQFVGETEQEQDRAYRLTVTQLDQAATAAAMLAQVVNGSGDKVGLMTYGRGVQQMLATGQGAGHLRVMIDLLSRTRSERAEADHLHAMARLKNAQRRRGLIVWVTEMADQAGRPEIVTAAAELVKQHLVVLVLLKHPELDATAAATPDTRDAMYTRTAAQEMLERRRETVAQLERQGVLIVETSAEEAGVRAIGKYLEVKSEGRL